MPADHPDTTYYCTQCRIETSLARVCPKCHRKTTLRQENQHSGGTGGVRRRTSANEESGAPPRPLWLWLLGGAMATAALVAVVWWGIARWRDSPVPKLTTGTNTAAFKGFLILSAKWRQAWGGNSNQPITRRLLELLYQ